MSAMKEVLIRLEEAGFDFNDPVDAMIAERAMRFPVMGNTQWERIECLVEMAVELLSKSKRRTTPCQCG